MGDRGDRLSDADRAPLDLWTAAPLTFHEGRGEFRTIPRLTPCRKPAYTLAMREELTRKDNCDVPRLATGDFWAFVILHGKQRCLQRSDLLTEMELDAEREKDLIALGALRARAQRNVGAQRANVDVDPDGMAGADARRIRACTDNRSER